jgi:hypothetical protein
MAKTFDTFFAHFDIDEAVQGEMKVYLSEMFGSIAMNLALNFNPSEEPKKKAEPKKKKEPEEKKNEPEEKKLCQGHTAKGEPCKNKALNDCDFCRVHSKKKDEEPKKKAEPKKKVEPKKKGKGKKKEVEHNHPLTEESVDGCEVCDTHGNSLKENGEQDEIFEKVDLNQKLMECIKESEGNDQDPFGLNLNPDLDMPDIDCFGEALESDSDSETDEI